MSEKLSPKAQEHLTPHESHEAHRKSEQLKGALERKAEHAQRHRESVETARSRVEKETLTGKEVSGKKTEKHHEDEYISKQQKKQSFDQTMRRVQSNLGSGSKTFSKVIHRPAVERVSEVAGKTIARPSSVIGGGLAVFIGLGYVLFIAKRVGFALSGSEFIILLASGWVAGLVIEISYKSARRALNR